MSEKMKKGQNRRKRILWFIMSLFLIWGCYTWYGQKDILEEKRTELETLQEEYQQVQKVKEQLEYDVQRLHDPEYIANLARKNYYLSREGEIIFEIIPKEGSKVEQQEDQPKNFP